MNRLLEIINDYYEELKQCLRIFRRKIRRIYRVSRFKWNNPKSTFWKKYIPKINKIVLNIKIFFEAIYLYLKEKFLIVKEYVKNNKEKSLFIGSGILGIFILLLILPSFAIYQNNFEFSFLANVVGDMYANDNDYTLLIYTEEVGDTGEGSGIYNLVEAIPTFGYAYSGYTCKNGSTLIYDEVTKTTSVTLDQREVCSIYFDLTIVADITLKVMLEDSVDSNTYNLGNNIPYFGYKYSHYECDNNSTLTYNSELHKVKIASTGKDYCRIYFQKEEADIEVRLFVEGTYQNKDYIERVNIPANKTYLINEEESFCTNSDNERIETEIGYVDGYIEITTTEKAYCNVYLDLANE